jgi:hypothetical protein
MFEKISGKSKIKLFYTTLILIGLVLIYLIRVINEYDRAIVKTYVIDNNSSIQMLELRLEITKLEVEISKHNADIAFQERMIWKSIISSEENKNVCK